MSRLRTSANAALAAFSVPRIFSNTQCGWKVSMNALERRLCRITCAGEEHTTKIGSPPDQKPHIGLADLSGNSAGPGLLSSRAGWCGGRHNFVELGCTGLIV